MIYVINISIKSKDGFGGQNKNVYFCKTLRGGAEVARWAHNPKARGSNPLPATPKGWITKDSTFFYLLHPYSLFQDKTVFRGPRGISGGKGR